MSPAIPERLEMRNWEEVMAWLDAGVDVDHDLTKFRSLHIWALVGLAALLRERGGMSATSIDASHSPSRFAYSVGFNAVIEGRPHTGAVQADRTVPIRSLREYAKIEATASDIINVLFRRGEDEGSRSTVYYILVEMLRNALQHSGRPEALVGAQRMDAGHSRLGVPVVQIAVADLGAGVLDTLSRMHENVTTPSQALSMSLQPYISSRFRLGLTEGGSNAGLGLFFVSEFAKKTAGQMILASRGAALRLAGDPEFEGSHEIRSIPHGFPGTLVAFELPLDYVADYDALIRTIQDLAAARVPRHHTATVFRYESDVAAADYRFMVSVGAENSLMAEEIVTSKLLPIAERGGRVHLMFLNVPICTQSYAHALVYRVIRAAARSGALIFVSDATPAVRSALDFVEHYATEPGSAS